MFCSFLKSEDLSSSNNLKTTIWFEKISPHHASLSIPIPLPISPFPIKLSFKTQLRPIQTKSLTTGDEIIIQQRGVLRYVIGIFEYYDVNSKRLFIKNNNRLNTILLDDIISIRLKIEGRRRLTLQGALLGSIGGMFLGGIENNSGNEQQAYKIVTHSSISGALLGSLLTISKSRNIIRFHHNQYEYRVLYHE